MYQFNNLLENKESCFGPDPHNSFDTNFDLLPEFNYYLPHEFHKKICTDDKTSKKALSLIHTNICSIMHNFEKLQILTNLLGYQFDIITLSETWSPETEKHLQPGAIGWLSSLCGNIWSHHQKWMWSLYQTINEIH